MRRRPSRWLRDRGGFRLLPVALAATFAFPLSASEENVPPPIETDLTEETLVRRVRWPVRFLPTEPGGCETLGPGDVEVREDGVSIAPEGVERRRLDTLHAILIDASPSMMNRLGTALRAARDYIDALPRDESVMLLSFGSNLVLHSPPTTDRVALDRALDKVGVRLGTALHDALYYTVRYLGSRPERKALVLLTDGCDTSSLNLRPLPVIRRMVEDSGDTVVFPIGISLPASCEALPLLRGPGGGPAAELARFARRSGGRLFKTEDAAALGHVFREIRRRMDQEGFVTYRPLEAGAIARDADDGGLRRRVRVRSTVPGCRIVSAGPAVRVEDERNGAIALDGEGIDAGPGRVGVGSRPDGSVIFEDWWPRAKPATARLRLGEGEVLGSASDILRERAGLYQPSAYWLRGQYRPAADRRPRLARREFRLRVPPFDVLREQLASPEDVLLYFFERGIAPFAAEGEDGRFRASRRELTLDWVHGQTLLELREPFGRALYGYAGYREFADAKRVEEYRAEALAALEEIAVRRGVSAEDLARVREAVEAVRPQPRPEELQRYLAEWIGDVSAHDLVVGLERALSNRILRGDLSGEPARRLLERVDRRWAELTDWFPPPTSVRVVAPLLPAFDADQGRIGFYRVVLPQVLPTDPPPDPVPLHPLGLAVVRRLLEGGIDDGLRDRLGVRAIDYSEPRGRALRRLVRSARRFGLVPPERHWRDVSAVRLAIDDGSSAAVAVDILFDPGGGRGAESLPQPICAASATRADTDALSALWLHVAPRCDATPADREAAHSREPAALVRTKKKGRLGAGLSSPVGSPKLTWPGPP